MNYKLMLSIGLIICDCAIFSLLHWLGNSLHDALWGTLIFSGGIMVFGLFLAITLLIVDFISRTVGGPDIVKDYWSLKRWLGGNEDYDVHRS